MSPDLPRRYQRVLRAFRDPDFYPERPARIDHRETHISDVFLTGSHAYKLKKPVDLGFVDMRDLETRRALCEEEVRLNRRLTTNVYQGVVPVIENGESLALEGEGRAVGYAVRMRQLREERTLGALLEAGEMDSHRLEELGVRLARFYWFADRSPQIDAMGEWHTVRRNALENFQQSEKHMSRLGLDRDRWTFVREATRAFLEDNGKLFQTRVRQWRICDGHGDLRSDHIYFDPDLQIIDCVEFDERYRYLDPVSDLGFLQSDLELRGFPRAASLIVESYVRERDDLDVYGLLDFYSCYRAMVRFKIACLQADAADTGAEDQAREKAAMHLELAGQYAVRFGTPRLWIMTGLPASGKSELARTVVKTHKAEMVSSDTTRQELAGSIEKEDRVTGYGEGLYSPQLRTQVYARMLLRAQELIDEGRSVVLDATYARRAWREEALRLGADQRCPVILVQTVCRREELERRLAARETELDGRPNGQPKSRARLQHLCEMERSYEPPKEVPREQKVVVSTDMDLEKSRLQVLAGGHFATARQTAGAGPNARDTAAG